MNADWTVNNYDRFSHSIINIPASVLIHSSAKRWWWWIGSITIHPLPADPSYSGLVFLHFYSACMKISATSRVRRGILSPRRRNWIYWSKIPCTSIFFIYHSSGDLPSYSGARAKLVHGWDVCWLEWLVVYTWSMGCHNKWQLQCLCRRWRVINANEDSNGGSSLAPSRRVRTVARATAVPGS